METIVYEIIRHSLYAIAREMKVAMMRTAASPGAGTSMPSAAGCRNRIRRAPVA